MVILYLRLRHIYGFEDFEVNFTYPKKVVRSFIENEHLKDRPHFRYKKAIVLMGANATGKTSLGRVLRNVFAYINTSVTADMYRMVEGDSGTVSIDFVNEDNILNRLELEIDTVKEKIFPNLCTADIRKNDTYKKCVGKLTPVGGDMEKQGALKNIVGRIDCRFAYPEIERKLSLNSIDKDVFLKTLKAVMGTLDPTLTDVSVSTDLADTFIIRRKEQGIIIQEGNLLNREVLSSGTVEGIDVALFLASMITNGNAFHYCDEHFSYIQSDIEKKIFGLMLQRVGDNGQLIFTTHNTDMLDLNLPKHSYVFLRKKKDAGEYRISAISASDILLKNTDSVRNAVENDVFESLPDDSLLNVLEKGWTVE